MPCWYYDKKDLANTPSFRDGISAETEARYRKDGARFILDAGAKMGLRYETCSTGVVYFHRFYMFHSFAEFSRCITAAGCLFLAGKVEETPKKCRDLIKISKIMFSEEQFKDAFKEDPKEEIMMMEKILLQTIKFDLNVEHPYAYLLKLAKLIKGDKERVQKLVQMSWTFVNDSLCTSLCLQWEADVIAVALIYLASRLNKFEITDWQGKTLGGKTRWYESFVEGVTLELLEDICHQVLDLYSKPSSKSANNSPQINTTRNAGQRKASQMNTTQATLQQQYNNQHQQQSSKPHSNNPSKNNQPFQGQSIPALYSHHTTTVPSPLITLTYPQNTSLPPSNNSSILPPPPHTQALIPSQASQWSSQQYNQNNPYIATTMFSSSFLSKEGTRSIQSLVNKQSPGVAYQSYPYQALQQTHPPPPPPSQPTLITTYPSQGHIAPPPPPPPPPVINQATTQPYQSYLSSEIPPNGAPIQTLYTNKPPLLAHPPHFATSTHRPNSWR